MKRLILLRHAEAQPSHAVSIDRDRPLSGHGLKQLDSLGPQLHQKFLGVDYVLCSNAKRTRQTFDGIKKYLPLTMNISFEDKLYGAPGHVLINRLRRVEDRYQTVFLVGHNPGLQQFLDETTARTPPSMMIHPFHTCTAAFFTVDAPNWLSVELSSFMLIQQLRPLM